MQENQETNIVLPPSPNTAEISGIIAEPPVYSHRMYQELFYIMRVEIARLSGGCDFIPVILSEKLTAGKNLAVGCSVQITGQVRSHILHVNHVRHKYVAVFALKIETGRRLLPCTANNRISLSGKVTNLPELRITPKGRTVADIELAVRRYYHKMDFIPLVIWNRNALALSGRPAGLWLNITGRIQSREFQRKNAEGTLENGLSIEISVSQMKIGEDPEQTEQAQYIADPPSVYHASGPEGPAAADSPDVPGRAAAVTFPVTPAG